MGMPRWNLSRGVGGEVEVEDLGAWWWWWRGGAAVQWDMKIRAPPVFVQLCGKLCSGWCRERLMH